ncbi:lysine-2,3-aminomutase-like protein [Rhizobium sp. C4]|uniref:lysine-2,3-aminomutase-like protein n=1 Tax=Rhizobium sp. C4 TaxID=1349800 RepID=UPI001E5A322E|nr:lysine-2,3-aminomutase-like protein [Rhizobium sp. C4]MCD2173997.1 lysine-2,3-aminomutase-like protein [Rhizobium sp. C4]
MIKAGASLTTLDDLALAGLVTPSPALEAVAARYAVAVTPEMAAVIERAGPDSAMARQFIPDARELDILPEESADPISDRRFTPVEGVVHRYPDRVLLKAVHVCPVYCRFCFRREMVGPAGDGLLAAEKLDAALAYIREHKEIWEVILTGGDPLVLSPRRLEKLLEPLSQIDHVKVIRFHSRVPLVDPERISGELIALLRATGKTVYVALHANHPDEFTAAGRKACARLTDAGIAMVSQSVLLNGVNDDAEVLARLMRTFVENRIKPYYLHHPDLAPGTAHFRLTVEEGQALVASLRGRLSGLCQPHYVLDIPGGHGKAYVNAAEHGSDDAGLTVTDYRGGQHRYP